MKLKLAIAVVLMSMCFACGTDESIDELNSDPDDTVEALDAADNTAVSEAELSGGRWNEEMVWDAEHCGRFLETATLYYRENTDSRKIFLESFKLNQDKSGSDGRLAYRVRVLVHKATGWKTIFSTGNRNDSNDKASGTFTPLAAIPMSMNPTIHVDMGAIGDGIAKCELILHPRSLQP